MKSCILTVIKNEHEYLDEWIKYHLDLGIDHIFIFEDIDSDFKSIEQKENSDKLVKTFKSEIIKHDNEVVKSYKEDKKLSVDDIMSFIQNS